MRKRKNFKTPALLLVISIILTSCGQISLPRGGSESDSGNANTDLWAEMQDSGVIRIGTEGVYSPFSYRDEDGNLTGYDVEVAKAMAAEMGVRAEFVETPWEDLFAGLDVGNYDVVMNQIRIMDDRAAKYDFSIPYAYTHAALIVKSENAELTFDDLTGKTIAATLDSEYAIMAQQLGADVVVAEDFDGVMKMVEEGEADGAIEDDYAFYDYRFRFPEADVIIAVMDTTSAENAVLMLKGQEALKNAIDSALQALLKDGTLTQISQSYFGVDISVEY